MGPDKGKTITVHDRIVEFNDNCSGEERALTYDPDARHVEIVAKAMGLDATSTKVVGAPVIRRTEYLGDVLLERGGHICCTRQGKQRGRCKRRRGER